MRKKKEWLKTFNNERWMKEKDVRNLARGLLISLGKDNKRCFGSPNKNCAEFFPNVKTINMNEIEICKLCLEIWWKGSNKIREQRKDL